MFEGALDASKRKEPVLAMRFFSSLVRKEVKEDWTASVTKVVLWDGP